MEIAYAAGITPEAFAEGEPAEAREIVRSLYDRRNSEGMYALIEEQRLSHEAADR
jgi:hypothetical protein